MRRLAFASEVITNPSILFCDEPTSGLDSFMAISVVECMRTLASRGKTIVCTIHQPSSEIFETFDNLFLMAEGRVAYVGSIPRANDFFKSLGYPCPANYNPADFFIKTLAIMPWQKEECKERVKKICDGFEESLLARELLHEISEANATGKSSALDLVDLDIKYKANTFTQMRWLIWRSFLSSIRNPLETYVLALQAVFIAIMFGLIYLQLKVNQQNIQNINSVLFLIITNASFSNQFAVLNTFPVEIPIFLREHQNRMYRVINYYLSKTLVEIPKYIIFPILFISIVYWMAGLNDKADRFLIATAVVVLVAQCAVSFGSFLSCAAPSVTVALALSGPVLVPLMVFLNFNYFQSF